MHQTVYRLQAQKSLLRTKKHAILVCLLHLSLRLFCVLSFGVCLYSLLHLREYPQATVSPYAEIGYAVFFAAAAVFCTVFFALFAFFKAGWFFENARNPDTPHRYFRPLSGKSVCKLFFWYYTKIVLCALLLLAYGAPFLVLSAYFWHILQTSGFSVAQFILFLALLVLLLPICLYFGLAAAGRYRFCNALFCLRPSRGLIETIRISRAMANEAPFAALHGQLHFLPWAAASLLVFPAFFALPYYWQTRAEEAVAVLHAHRRLPRKAAPIRILCGQAAAQPMPSKHQKRARRQHQQPPSAARGQRFAEQKS